MCKMAMPKMHSIPMQSAAIAQPTPMLKPCPFTAEIICPAMMHAIMPHPVCMMMLSRQASLAGQYPTKNLDSTMARCPLSGPKVDVYAPAAQPGTLAKMTMHTQSTQPSWKMVGPSRPLTTKITHRFIPNHSANCCT